MRLCVPMWDHVCLCVTIDAHADGTGVGQAFRLPGASGSVRHLALELHWQHQCNRAKLGHACKRNISAHQVSKAFLCMSQALVSSF